MNRRASIIILIGLALAFLTVGTWFGLRSSRGPDTESNSAVAIADGPSPERTLQFPAENSFGTLWTRPWLEIDTGAIVNEVFWESEKGWLWDFLADAQGPITIPAAMEIRLVLSRDAIPSTSMLQEIVGDGLYGLFTTSAFSDANVPSLTNLRGLRELSLFGSSITDRSLEHISRIDTLQILDLRGTQVSNEGMAFLSRLPQLRSLNLLDTDIDDAGLRHIGRIRSLEELILNGEEVTDDGLSHLGGLGLLKTFILASNDRITDEGLSVFARLTKLQTLRIDSRIQGYGAGLSHLRNVTSLKNISMGTFADLTYDELLELQGLKDLRVLFLWGTSISQTGIDALQQALPECIIRTYLRVISPITQRSRIGPSPLPPGGRFSAGTGLSRGDVRQYGNLWIKLDWIDGDPSSVQGIDGAAAEILVSSVPALKAGAVPRTTILPHRIRLRVGETSWYDEMSFSLNWISPGRYRDGNGSVGLKMKGVAPSATPVPPTRPPVS